MLLNLLCGWLTRMNVQCRVKCRIESKSRQPKNTLQTYLTHFGRTSFQLLEVHVDNDLVYGVVLLQKLASLLPIKNRMNVLMHVQAYLCHNPDVMRRIRRVSSDLSRLSCILVHLQGPIYALWSMHRSLSSFLRVQRLPAIMAWIYLSGISPTTNDASPTVERNSWPIFRSMGTGSVVGPFFLLMLRLVQGSVAP